LDDFDMKMAKNCYKNGKNWGVAGLPRFKGGDGE
jgi:hypothetical protein